VNIPDFSGFVEIFQFLTVLERPGRFWEASKPQYSYRNIEVFSMGRPGDLEIPPKPVFGQFLWNSLTFCRKEPNSMKFDEILPQNRFLSESGGPRPPQDP